MKIDNTMFSMYMKCPKMFYERYEAPNDELQNLHTSGSEMAVGGAKEPSNDGLGPTGELHILNSPASPAGRGIELDRESEGRDFGTRLHQLLHERRQLRLGLRPAGQSVDASGGQGGLSKEFNPAPEWPNEEIEAEAQATFAAYEAHYIRDFEYLESERTSVVPIERVCPECGGEGLRKLDLQIDQRVCQDCGRIYIIHELVVKLDAVVRYADGTIGPFDTKSESKPGYNTREDWAGRTQAKIYLYALGSLYPNEKVSRLTVDVVTRGSPKARRGPIFSRLDDIASSPADIEEAIRNVSAVADDIQLALRRGFWRSNMNLCKKGWEKCDFYDLHVLGRTAENLRKYRPAEQYLDL